MEFRSARSAPRSTAAAPRAEGQRKSNGDHELVFIIFRVLPDRRSRSGFPLLLEASLWWRNLLGDPAPPSICMPAARCVDANSDLNQANMWPCFALLSSKEGPWKTTLGRGSAKSTTVISGLSILIDPQIASKVSLPRGGPNPVQLAPA